MVAKVYRNLKFGRSAQPLYSLMVDGHVIDRRHTVTLTDVRFVVSEAGRERAIRDHQRNVHAFVVGTVVEDRPLSGHVVPVTYNPFVGNRFHVVGGEPIEQAREVRLDEAGMTAVL